jgi:hypothetical protein
VLGGSEANRGKVVVVVDDDDDGGFDGDGDCG